MALNLNILFIYCKLYIELGIKLTELPNTTQTQILHQGNKQVNQILRKLIKLIEHERTKRGGDPMWKQGAYAAISEVAIEQTAQEEN
jgi:hypothetical protein